MTKTLTDRLLDLAEWIAPPHRREWIEGLRAEAGIADRPTGWAWGAVTTALGQRLADALVSGQALRLVLGGFVMGVAADLAVFVLVRYPNMQAVAARGSVNLTSLTLGLAAIFALILSGGLAILFAARRPWVERYGRALFALGALWAGSSLTLAACHSTQCRAATTLQHQVAALSGIEGPLFVAAALALIFRWKRLFPVLALGALSAEIAQYAIELPHLHLHELAAYARGFFSASLDGWILLAAAGLLIGRRTPATA